MMKHKAYYNCILIFSILVVISSLFVSTTQNVVAETQSDADAIASAPDGLNINNYFYKPSNIFMNPGVDNDPYQTNDASIVSRKATTSDPNPTPNTILDLAKGSSVNGSTGAIWANPETPAQNDLSVDQSSNSQTISAWLYFGPGTTDTNYNGQGIALVLQNDDRGQHAMGAGQEGLGVNGLDLAYRKPKTFYGYETSYVDNKYVAKTAVQNSIALEFDTQLNNANSEKSSLTKLKDIPNGKSDNYYSLNAFDTVDTQSGVPTGYPDNTLLGASDNGYGHISLSYPGNLDSYKLTKNITSSGVYTPFTQVMSLYQSAKKVTYLVSGNDSQGKPTSWHHVTFTWNQPTSADSTIATIHYSFNDKDTDGTTIPVGGGTSYGKRIDQDIKVDEKFLNLKANQKSIMWGFTGANSSTEGVNSKLVVFESIPGLLNATAQSQIYDEDLDRTIPNKENIKDVTDGDKVNLLYDLNYDSGKVAWEKINANIKTPDHFTPRTDSSGNIGKITYSNGLFEYISASDFNSTTKKVTHRLGKNLDKTESAQITINGIVDNTTTKDIDIKPAPARFDGSNSMVSASTPSFTIKYRRDWNLVLANPDDIDLAYNNDDQGLELPTNLSYTKDHNFTSNDQLQYLISFGGYNLTAVDSVNSNSSTFTGSIPLKKVIVDDKDLPPFWSLFPPNSTQQVTVKAIDKDDLISNTVTYNIHVLQNKLLKVDAPDTLEFQDVNHVSADKHLYRKTPYTLQVTSYRTPWDLSATATKLYNDKIPFNGNLIYKYQNDKVAPLNSQPTLIVSDSTSHDPESTYVVSESWKDDSGLLLQSNGQSSAGKYSGKVTWTATDQINN